MKLVRRARREIDMVNGPLIGPFIKYAIPLMLSGMLQLLFNAADMAVVGRFGGENALAAVGSTGALCGLFVNMFIGFAVGANVAAARAAGAGDHAELSRVVHTSVLTSLVCGGAVMVLGLVFAPTMLEMMDTPKEVIGDATLYMRIYFVGMLPSMVYNFGAAILRSIGDTRRPLTYLTVAGVVNVALNLVFVIAFDMDVAGVGVATAISQTISAALVVICLMRSHGAVRLDIRKMRFHKAALKLIVIIGVPASVQGVLFSVANVMIQSTMNGFGAVAVAGNSAGSNIDGFVSTAMGAFDQAAVSFTGQSYGAKRYGRIWKIMRTALLLDLALGLPASIAVWYFGETLLRIYTDSQPVIDAGMVRLTYVCLPYFIAGMMNCTVSVLRGIGKSVLPTIVTICGVCGLRFLWILVVCDMPRFAGRLEFVHASYPISWFVTLVMHLICFVFAMRQLKKRAIAENWVM